MAKLNKQEIKAVASKLHRKLQERASENRRNAIRNYTSSANYNLISNLFTQRDNIDSQIVRLNKQREDIIDQVDKILFDNYGIEERYNHNSDYICKRIIDCECKVKEVPCIEELIEDVTIAAIDDSFDTSSFIEEQLTKFQ